MSQPKIRQLPANLVNQIAAGEVLERPAAAVKELVENALDAKARQIDVTISEGGKNLITVSDDGVGMTAEDLPLALQRHATSKLPSDDLMAIHSLGFRGEALPSIAAVARLTVTSRVAQAPHGWKITVEGGTLDQNIGGLVQPAARQSGTLVEVRDLFFATPARLKFLKSTRSESEAVHDVITRLALAYPAVGFSLSEDGRVKLRLVPENLAPESLVRAGLAPENLVPESTTPALGGDANAHRRARLRHIMGDDFATNALPIHAEREGVILTGFAGLPSFHRSNNLMQYLFVNDRPVRDRLLLSCVRVAYGDTLPPGRHPVLALYLQLPESELDVNVHPTKAEVRFRQPALIRSLLITGISQSLIQAGHRSSSTGGDAALSVLEQRVQQQQAQGGGYRAGSWPGSSRPGSSRPGSWPGSYQAPAYRPASAPDWQAPLSPPPGTVPLAGAVHENMRGFRYDTASPVPANALFAAAPAAAIEENPEDYAARDFPLGAARAQLHATYIISETPDSVILVDQHAAHERLVYERLKSARAVGGIATQTLLIPEIVELTAAQCRILLAHQSDLSAMGLAVEEFGDGAVAIPAIPAALSRLDVKGLIQDLADGLAADRAVTDKNGEAAREIITDNLNHIAASLACHGSVRAGQKLSAAEMNGLLREMETTPLSGTCNHGRPTWIELKKSDLERLFARR
ncbi:MAG: DNA mismatch repair endonuclease MutL [Candidatus Symbiobacter sp.]|nr:DNA mismatch repair endonuclease MutL [Candidatus Symbiobacter sp.]